MAIRFFAISCSSDCADLNVSDLYVWGELKAARWMPQSIKEAKKRVLECRAATQCRYCDAEIHDVQISQRHRTTLKQMMGGAEKVL